MQSLQILSGSTGSPADTQVFADTTPKPSSNAAQFDALMGRALSRSSSDRADDSEPADDRVRDRNRSKPSRDARSSDSNSPDRAAAAAQLAGSDSPAPASNSRGAASKESASTLAGQATVADNGATVSGGKAEESSQTTPSVAAKSAGDLATEVAPSASAGSATQAAQGKVAPDNTAAASPKAGAPGDPPILEREKGEQSAGALGGKAPSPANPARDAAAGAGVRAGPAGSPEITGISGAQQHLPMQQAEKMNEITGLAEQNLPSPADRPTGKESPARVLPVNSSLPRLEKPDEAVATDSPLSAMTATTDARSTANVSADWPSMSQTRTLERTHDLMSLHAFRLRDSGADSLQVVIKPGPGLHLSLNLQMRDGGVEMRAMLHRGDFDFLNRHWNDLQQQLEQRGVRLAPLASPDHLAGGDPNHFQQPNRRETEPDTAPGDAVPEFGLAPALAPAAAAKTQVTRGWETWA